MVERKHFYRLYYHDKTSFFIALLVAAVTVTQDAIVGILLGTVIALLILVNKLSQSYYEITVHESPAEHKAHNAQAQKRNILIYTFKGKLVYLNNQAHIMHFRTDFTCRHSFSP
jgi:MFS superfamily sulfate permease-like transporter